MLVNWFGMDVDVLVRAFAAFFVSLVLSLVFGNKVINCLRKCQQHGQPIREDGPQSHIVNKQGTPTMGGLLILATSIFSSLLFANVTYHFVWVSLLVLVVYGAAGFIDDYIKVSKQTPNALTAKAKLFFQFLTAVIAVTIITAATPKANATIFSVPYFKAILNLSWLYIPFAVVVISGTSNAVNLTDGLDGLASGLLIMSFIFFGIIAYIAGSDLALGFQMAYIPRCGEISVVCASVVGAAVVDSSP